MKQPYDRRQFLQAAATAAGATLLAGSGLSQPKPVSPQKPVRLGFVGVGGRGSYHLDCALGIEGVQVPAVCDIDDVALYTAKRWVEEAGQRPPRTYGESRTAFQQLCEKEDLDCVICCTSWEWHAPVCLAAMRNGKHAVSEVPMVITLEEAWEVVETHEKTGKWATIGLEGSGDLNLLHLVRQGMLGDIVHAEGGYVHDLRMVKFNPEEEPWRLQHSLERNGNLYPDHPMARIMPLLNINRGDRFDYLVSMSSKAVMLNRYAALQYGEKHPYAAAAFALGDYNATLLRTVEGKMVTLNHDTGTPHPREFFRLQGTKGVYQSATGHAAVNQPRGAGASVYIEGRSPVEHQWEPAEPYLKEFQHPYLKTYKSTERKKEARGHGGGSKTTPLVWDRLVAALRNNKMTDWDVYNSVTSGAISPLTEKSVAARSAPVDFPDFTRGKWKTAKPIEIT